MIYEALDHLALPLFPVSPSTTPLIEPYVSRAASQLLVNFWHLLQLPPLHEATHGRGQMKTFNLSTFVSP